MKTRVISERRRFQESSVLFKSEMRAAIDAAISNIRVQRMELITYITQHPSFRDALIPYPVATEAPRVVKLMVESTDRFEVGPMAAVAGVLADLAVETMRSVDAKVAIVENGGEIAAWSEEPFTIALHIGANPLSNSLGFQVAPSDCPIGIATSSASVGSALSFGEADSVTIFTNTAGIADGAATAVCNSVQGSDLIASVQKGLEKPNHLGS